MKAYTLKRRKETEEYHLFEGDFSKEPCTSVNESICKKWTNQKVKEMLLHAIPMNNHVSE